MTQQEQALLQTAIDRGVLLYMYDQAAWHGTDDMREKMKDRLGEVGGWIVEGPAAAPHLLFLDHDEADPHAVYTADFKGKELAASHVLGPSDDRSLTGPERAMAAALRTARKAAEDAHTGYCVAKPFNTVVLPATTGSPIRVYLLTPQTKTDALPFAGHYLVEVGEDGRAGPVQRFTKSDCAEIPLNEPSGKKSSALMVTDLLHPVPTEIHVFSSLSGQIPVYVLTTVNKHLWAVEGSRVRLVQADVSKEKAAPAK